MDLERSLEIWNQRFNSHVLKIGFKRSSYDFCLNYKLDVFLFFLLMMDWLSAIVEDLVNHLRNGFNIKVMDASNFLRMIIEVNL